MPPCCVATIKATTLSPVYADLDYFVTPKLWMNLEGTFDLDQATNRRKTA